MQLVGYRDELTAGQGHTLRYAIRRNKLRVGAILLAGSFPRRIRELVDELHYPAQLDLRDREHT